MKKFVILPMFSMVFCVWLCWACYENNRFVSNDELPAIAHEFLEHHLKDHSVASINRYGIRGRYDVMLTDGTDVDFYRKGHMHTVEIALGNQMPESLLRMLPPPVMEYIEYRYANGEVMKIYDWRGRWGVELVGINGVLVFSKEGDFLDRL